MWKKDKLSLVRMAKNLQVNNNARIEWQIKLSKYFLLFPHLCSWSAHYSSINCFQKGPYYSCYYAGTLGSGFKVSSLYVQRSNVISNCCAYKITPDSENSNTSWASEKQYVYHSICNMVLITTFSHDNIYTFELMFSCGMSWFNLLHATALCLV